jgi:hypothetical protein
MSCSQEKFVLSVPLFYVLADFTSRKRSTLRPFLRMTRLGLPIWLDAFYVMK